MAEPLAVPQLLAEWLSDACSLQEPGREPAAFVGFSEFLWLAAELPEYACSALLLAVRDPRFEPYLEHLV
jgi:hypothetical protein